MRPFLTSTGMLLLALAGACTSANESRPPPRHHARPVAVVAVETNVPWQQTVWKGTLTAAPSNGTERAATMLRVEASARPFTYLLRAEDPVLATRMRDLGRGRKGAAVVLNGQLDPDGATILVTEILPLPKERKPERK